MPYGERRCLNCGTKFGAFYGYFCCNSCYRKYVEKNKVLLKLLRETYGLSLADSRKLIKSFRDVLLGYG